MSDDFYLSPTLQKLIKGSKGKWLYLLFYKWYILIAIPSFLAAYYFFYALNKIGILDKIHDFIESHLKSLVEATEACTPLITSLSEFFDCVSRF